MGFTAAAFSNENLWPFVKYNMYSSSNKDFNLIVSIEGIGEGKEIYPMQKGYVYDAGSLEGIPLRMTMLYQSSMDNELRNKLVSKLCREFIKIYNSRKLKGLHNGPSLIGLRINLNRWQNLISLKQMDQPDQIETVYEEFFDKN